MTPDSQFFDYLRSDGRSPSLAGRAAAPVAGATVQD
jgi:hypothetical protein